MTRGRLATGIAGAAAVIAVVTVLARVVGFGRWLVFAGTVSDSCLGTAYSTANMLPNIVFEVVAGGALASAVVPLLGAQLARGEQEQVRRTASALLTWSLLALVPLAALCVLAAGPLMGLLVRHPISCDAAAVRDAAAHMFAVFAPQIPLYGVAVVCGGILNAHRRFLAAAFAPLASSAVVIATYLAFARGWSGSRADVGAIPDRWLAVLSAGTTAGVVVLMLVLLAPVLTLGRRLRPTLRFPPGVAPQARRLATAGVTVLVAQQATVLVVVFLANRAGGAINLYNYAWAVYLLPYAVLAVPIATAAFPALSAHQGRADDGAFQGTAARTTRAVVLACLLGAGLLAGTADPVARTFLARPGSAPSWQLAWALVAYAPGLVGYGLVAHLGRVLYARHLGRAAATATVAGWAVVLVATVVLVPRVGAGWIVTAVGAANSLGMLVAGGALLAVLRRHVGDGSLAGVGRALAAGAVGAGAAAGAAAAVATAFDVHGELRNGALAAGCGIVALVAYAAVVVVLDGADLRALVTRRFARA